MPVTVDGLQPGQVAGQSRERVADRLSSAWRRAQPSDDSARQHRDAGADRIARGSDADAAVVAAASAAAATCSRSRCSEMVVGEDRPRDSGVEARLRDRRRARRGSRRADRLSLRRSRRAARFVVRSRRCPEISVLLAARSRVRARECAVRSHDARVRAFGRVDAARRRRHARSCPRV